MKKVKTPVKTPLDPYLPLFTVDQLAAVSGLSRTTVNLWGSRGLLDPTRRDRTSRDARGRPTKRRGKPMFSVAAIFRARLAHDLESQMGVGLAEWRIRLAKLIEAGEKLALVGWMEASARYLEADTPFRLCGYAAFIDGEWTLQVQAGMKPKEPNFGVATPYIVIPMSDIFAAVYRECKKLLGKD